MSDKTLDTLNVAAVLVALAGVVAFGLGVSGVVVGAVWSLWAIALALFTRAARRRRMRGEHGGR
jgi:hypothetical protein